MRGKREFVARTCAQTGITKLLEKLPQRSVLIILNYHRVGDAAATPFDPGTFSATAAELESQIRYFQSRFEMATLETALAMLNGEAPRRTSMLITFDDGYLDNYMLAFPILRKQVSGDLFLPTGFIGEEKCRGGMPSPTWSESVESGASIWTIPLLRHSIWRRMGTGE